MPMDVYWQQCYKSPLSVTSNKIQINSYVYFVSYFNNGSDGEETIQHKINEFINVNVEFVCRNHAPKELVISTILLKDDLVKDVIKILLKCKEADYSEKCICKSAEAYHSQIGKVFCSSFHNNVSQFVINLDIIVPVIEKSKLYAEFHEDTDFTDFHLSAADGTVPVHKLVIAAHSDMFKTMLSGDWKEKEEATVELKDCSRQTLQHLKDYMYLGTLPDEGLKDLLLLATHYLVLGLKEACIRKLTLTVTSENFYELLEFAFENRILVPELMLNLVEIASNNNVLDI